MNILLEIGSKVTHSIHWAGIIIAYNPNLTAVDYNNRDYPYVVQFLNGHSDYYAETDLTSLE